jgi:hypothetical protein
MEVFMLSDRNAAENVFEQGRAARGIEQVRGAVEELAARDLPWVWIGEPRRDGNEEPVGRRAGWLGLSRFVENLLPDCLMDELTQASLDVLAAKRSLVPVRKVLPLDGMTLGEAHLFNDTKRNGVVLPRDSDLPLQEHVREGSALVYMYRANREVPMSHAMLIRFLHVDKLEIEHLPFVEAFVESSGTRHQDHGVGETEEVMFVATVLEDISSL